MKAGRLNYPLSLSIAVHLVIALILLNWPATRQLAVSTEAVGKPLTVALRSSLSAQPSRSAGASSPSTREDNRAQRITAQKNAASKPVVPAVAANNVTQSIPQPTEAEPRHSKPASTAATLSTTEYARLSNDMRDYLSSEFQLRFKYPLLARKRGWQGRVVVGMNISQQGQITYVAVKHSSGYGILDRNAVDTFRAIGRLTPELRTHLYRDHQLFIPVIYTLTGG